MAPYLMLLLHRGFLVASCRISNASILCSDFCNKRVCCYSNCPFRCSPCSVNWSYITSLSPQIIYPVYARSSTNFSSFSLTCFLTVVQLFQLVLQVFTNCTSCSNHSSRLFSTIPSQSSFMRDDGPQIFIGDLLLFVLLTHRFVRPL